MRHRPKPSPSPIGFQLPLAVALAVGLSGVAHGVPAPALDRQQLVRVATVLLGDDDRLQRGISDITTRDEGGGWFHHTVYFKGQGVRYVHQHGRHFFVHNNVEWEKSVDHPVYRLTRDGSLRRTRLTQTTLAAALLPKTVELRRVLPQKYREAWDVGNLAGLGSPFFAKQARAAGVGQRHCFGDSEDVVHTALNWGDRHGSNLFPGETIIGMRMQRRALIELARRGELKVNQLGVEGGRISAEIVFKRKLGQSPQVYAPLLDGYRAWRGSAATSGGRQPRAGRTATR